MIVDNSDSTNKTANMSHASPAGPPPSYENAVGNGPFIAQGSSKAENLKAAPVDHQPFPYPDPSPAVVPASPGQGPTVHYYRNPATGEQIASLLPPDHPQMVCLQEGRHVTDSRFGLLGVLAAVFWFPAGVICCLLDRHVVCKRCGLVISQGLTPSFD